MSSNWAKLQKKIEVTKTSKQQIVVEETTTATRKRKRGASRHEINDAVTIKKAKETVVIDTTTDEEKAKYIALDCEMVGIGTTGKTSALARCSLVDYDGNKLYDKYVRPKSFVTDFRTKYSGIRVQDLRQGHAITFEECMRDVAELLRGKILVGHALKNDLAVLMLDHHPSMIRDTAKYPPFMRQVRPGGKLRPRALRDLSKQYLGETIQTGEHDPGEDARAAMMLYRAKKDEWEQWIKTVAKEKRDKMKAASSKKKGPKKNKGQKSQMFPQSEAIN